MEELMLNEASFPSGDWQQLGLPRPRGAPSSVGVEKLGTSFTAGQGEVAVIGVYRFFDDGSAERGFRDMGGTWFREDPYETTWFVPEQITVNPTADRYRLACNFDDAFEVHQCRYIGKYGVYVVDAVPQGFLAMESAPAWHVTNSKACQRAGRNYRYLLYLLDWLWIRDLYCSGRKRISVLENVLGHTMSDTIIVLNSCQERRL
jgi:hypothetical protein